MYVLLKNRSLSQRCPVYSQPGLSGNSAWKSYRKQFYGTWYNHLLYRHPNVSLFSFIMSIMKYAYGVHRFLQLYYCNTTLLSHVYIIIVYLLTKTSSAYFHNTKRNISATMVNRKFRVFVYLAAVRCQTDLSSVT